MSIVLVENRYKLHVHITSGGKDTPCTSIPVLLVMERIHPAHPYYYWWKGYTLHVYTAGDGKGYAMHVNTAGDGNEYTLQVHSEGGGKRYTLHTGAFFCQLWKRIHFARPKFRY
jgi:hypothetical protein